MVLGRAPVIGPSPENAAYTFYPPEREALEAVLRARRLGASSTLVLERDIAELRVQSPREVDRVLALHEIEPAD